MNPEMGVSEQEQFTAPNNSSENAHEQPAQSETQGKQPEFTPAQLLQMELNLRKGIIEHTRSKIEAFEQRLRTNKASLMGRITHYFENNRLEKNIAGNQSLVQKYEAFVLEHQQLVDTANQQIDAEVDLQSAKVQEPKQLEQAEPPTPETEAGKSYDLKQLCTEKNTLIIHGIQNDFVLNANTMLAKGTSWQTKVDILLGLQPTISTSTVSSGDKPVNMWSPMGVVLKEGNVIAAAHQDAATKMEGLKRRKTWEVTDIKKDIDRAISARSPKDYNELVVENPEVAAFYVNLDYQRQPKDTMLASNRDILQAAIDRNLPLIGLVQGEPYQVQYNPETDRFEPVAKYERDQVLNSDYAVDPEKRKKLVEKVLDESPFKVKSPEINYLQGYESGAQSYVELMPPERSKFEESSHNYIVNNGEKATLIEDSAVIGGRRAYLRTESGLLIESTYDNKTKQRTERVLDSRHAGYIVGQYGMGKVDVNVHSPDRIQNYLDALKKKALELRGYLGQSNTESATDKQFRESLTSINYTLHGFRSQALKVGDYKTSDMTDKVIAEIRYVQDSDLAKLLRERVKPDGGWKMTLADIE